MYDSRWYKRKGYPHFDWPLTFEKARSIVENPCEVAQRSFWPLIFFEKRERKYKRDNGLKRVVEKIRPLSYSSHIDGYIYSYYGYLLRAKYEDYLKTSELQPAVVGYRRGLGGNVSIATRFLKPLRHRRNAAILCYDISSFFDSIDHAVLKRNLKQVLGFQSLPDDWYNIYKAITRYSFIRSSELPNYRASRICSPAEFRERYAPKIEKNLRRAGIPQGTSISDILSNVYMIEFDKEVFDRVSKIGGVYQRYADDIVVVCPMSQHVKIDRYIKKSIEILGDSIKLNEEKTERCFISRQGEKITITPPVQYLGIWFDGNIFKIRNKTLSRYYAKLTRQIKASNLRSKKVGTVRKRSVLRNSHLGKRSFYSYARQVARITGDTHAKRQLRNHMKFIKRGFVGSP